MSPTGLRDGGRDDDDYDTDERVPDTRRARDAGGDARAPGARVGATDAGSQAPSASRPRDAAARVDADAAPTGVNTASQPPLIPNTPVSAPVNGLPTAGNNQITDRAIADRSAEERSADRDAEQDEEDEESDERQDPRASPSRTRDGSNPSSSARDAGASTSRSGRGPVAPQCRSALDCPASACELTEYACCGGGGTCGCKPRIFSTCR